MKPMKNKVLIGLAGFSAAMLGVGLGAEHAWAQEGISALKGHDTNAPIDISADRAEAQDRADLHRSQ